MSALQTQGLAMAPVSPAIAQLLHTLHAQLEREASERIPSPDCLVLRPRAAFESAEWYSVRGGGQKLIVRHADNTSDRYWREHVGDPQYPRFWAHGVYWGSQERKDEFGRYWEGARQWYVTDDFGSLVETQQ